MANGDNLTIGADNFETDTTSLNLQPGGQPRRDVFRVINYSDGRGIFANADADDAVYATSNDGSGVTGVSNNIVGVLGALDGPGQAGVMGMGGTGVAGIGGKKGKFPFVHFTITQSIGVSGVGEDWGVVGQGNVGVSGTGDAYGVVGTSGSGTGVSGSGVVGVYGAAPGDPDDLSDSYGVYGVAHGQRGTAIYGFNHDGIAGWFDGGVLVEGPFKVTGVKAAVVRHPDGSHRQLYSMESPESWFEDFGQGRLVRGKGKVKLERHFAALVRRDEYHIFLTPRGDSNGLFVSKQNSAGFEVREQKGGKSSLKFSYRVVARRKDIKGSRLEKVRIPAPPKPPKPPKEPKWVEPRDLPESIKKLRELKTRQPKV